MLSGAVAATFGSGPRKRNRARPLPQVRSLSSKKSSSPDRASSSPRSKSVSPVTTVSVEQIQQTGTPRLEDILNQLPQVVGDMGSALANGATGAATVSLRGLGCQRTLVLVNGRRLMPGDPTEGGTSCSDLNQIPSDLVERVDVLTGGASAVYGADAVAGVVNFKMNDHFEGVRLDVGDGMYNHSQHDGGARGRSATRRDSPRRRVRRRTARPRISPPSSARISTTARAMRRSISATGTPIRCCKGRATTRRAR